MSQTILLSIQGMTCASCLAHIEKELNSVSGVIKAQVNLATESAEVTTSRETKLEDLHAAVEKAGYSIAPSMRTFRIRGMTCASCVGRMEASLLQVQGVESASVNLATEMAQVLGKVQVTAEDIQNAILQAGYESELVVACFTQ